LLPRIRTIAVGTDRRRFPLQGLNQLGPVEQPTPSALCALGADAVCLGRPYIWGLALEGQAGVETVLKMILAELDLTLALCGYTSPEALAEGQSQ
jgi:hypothetical protein